jgi:hypothetical protein
MCGKQELILNAICVTESGHNNAIKHNGVVKNGLWSLMPGWQYGNHCGTCVVARVVRGV